MELGCRSCLQRIHVLPVVRILTLLSCAKIVLLQDNDSAYSASQVTAPDVDFATTTSGVVLPSSSPPQDPLIHNTTFYDNLLFGKDSSPSDGLEIAELDCEFVENSRLFSLRYEEEPPNADWITCQFSLNASLTIPTVNSTDRLEKTLDLLAQDPGSADALLALSLSLVGLLENRTKPVDSSLLGQVIRAIGIVNVQVPHDILQLECRATPNLLLKVLEDILDRIPFSLDGNVTIANNNFTATAFEVGSGSSERPRFTGFSVTGSENVSFIAMGQEDELINGKATASLILPTFLVKQLYAVAGRGKKVRGAFHVFRSPDDFRATLSVISSPNGSDGNPSTAARRPKLVSWIVGAQFSETVTNWTDNVTITFRTDNETIIELLDYVCSFWNTSANPPFGNWSSDGCWTVVSNGQVTCLCNHLTSFGVIAYPRTDPSVVDNAISDYATKIALSISIVALLATMALILVVRKCLRPKKERLTDNDLVMFNVSGALALAYIVFLAGIDQTSPAALCASIGVLLHYLLLVPFAWLSVQGFVLVKKLAFGQFFTLQIYRVRTHALTWGLPWIFLIINLSMDWTMYTRPTACFLGPANNDLNHALTFILPIVLVFAGNFIAFAVILKMTVFARLSIRSTRKTPGLAQQLCSTVSLGILLGLPWIVLVIAMSGGEALSSSLVMEMFICVICGGQGIGIFIVHASSGEIRRMFPRSSKSHKSNATQMVRMKDLDSSVTASSFLTPKGFSITDAKHQ